MQDLDRITSPDRDFHASIQFVYYVQYQLHRQLLTVSKYAAEHQVVLKGDLPIGEPRAAILCPVRLPDCRSHHPIYSAARASASKPSKIEPFGSNRLYFGAGVDKRSVDTWLHPTQFRMNVGTGAPPDMFATLGQNWGFPTYVWSEMEKDGYRFWRQRLTHMSQCAATLTPVPWLSLA
jgi:4-alpha-glucanotransferase